MQYRIIWNSISTSQKIRKVEGDKWFRVGCHLTYTWLLPWTDDDGRMRGEPDWIRVNVLPYEGFTDKEVEKMLLELSRVNLIVWYEVDGEKFIEIINNKQNIRKDRYKVSVFPCQPDVNQMSDDGLTAGYGSVFVTGNGNGNGNGVGNKRKEKREKEVFGEFKNVKLMPEQYEKLKTKFGVKEADERIESLSEYIQAKGDKYKDHYATILMWDRKNGKEGSGHKQSDKIPPALQDWYDQKRREKNESDTI